MKLASYSTDGKARFGVVVDDGVIDLDERLGLSDLQQLIEKDALTDARRILEATGTADRPTSDIRFLPPVTRPGKIWCIGVNYADRNAEYRDGSEAPRYPSLFCRAATSFVGHGEPVERPKVSEQLDYEGEIALVIGRQGRHIPKERALDHVFGLTLCNEGTVRDWLRHGKFNVTQGKNFDRSGSIGPWIVTTDELSPKGPFHLKTRVNGELRQDDTTERMMFPFEDLIAYLSTFATLLPGDIIVTGTPTGAGVRFDPPRWLSPGDVVEVEVEGLGVLRNPVAHEGEGARPRS